MILGDDRQLLAFRSVVDGLLNLPTKRAMFPVMARQSADHEVVRSVGDGLLGHPSLARQSPASKCLRGRKRTGQ